MSDSSGYIKIHRSLLNWRWFNDANTFRVWIYLLLKANYKEIDFEGITVKRGEAVTSYLKIAESLGLSIQQARTTIAHLKSTGEITVRIYPKFQVISIANYDLYQDCATGNLTGNQQAINRQPNSQSTASKERKEIKEGNNNSECAHTHARTHAHAHEEKKQYAEFVFMTEKQHSDLLGVYGEEDTERMINILNNHKGSTGRTYDSDYHAILQWVVDRLKNDKAREARNGSLQKGPQDTVVLEDNFDHDVLEMLTRKGG